MNEEHNPRQFDDDYAWQDDYTELHLDDATYGDFDWDDLDPKLVDRHDAILEMDAEALGALDDTSLDDFHRWAAARAWLRVDQPERFQALTRKILSTAHDKRTKLLSYPDITLALARALAAEGDLDDALAHLETYRLLDGADGAEHARHMGLILLESDQHVKGLDILLDALKTYREEEPELGLHLAEDLLELGQKDAARAVLDAARQQAAEHDQRELLQELNDTIAAYFNASA